MRPGCTCDGLYLVTGIALYLDVKQNRGCEAMLLASIFLDMASTRLLTCDASGEGTGTVGGEASEISKTQNQLPAAPVFGLPTLQHFSTSTPVGMFCMILVRRPPISTKSDWHFANIGRFRSKSAAHEGN